LASRVLAGIFWELVCEHLLSGAQHSVMPPTPTRTTSSASGSASASQEDEELRPYIIVSDIGKGSFATVYKGYHEVRVFVW
jgi:serine/threonine-protein kinase ULK/ATG1